MTGEEKILLVVLGPTAIGKTALSIKLAKKFKTEIISADSRQFYSDMYIGVATPTIEERQGIPHHFMQFLGVTDYYNASMFEQETLKLLKELFKKHSVVIMTGGSGLYIDAVCKGIDDFPTTKPEIREMYERRLKEEGVESLRFELKRIDPEYYEKADIKNPKRILKALEVFAMTGKPYSQFLTNPVKPRDFKIVKIGLNTDREVLFNRINARVDAMIEQGLVDEVKSLTKHRNTNALNTVGYKEIFSYLDKTISLTEATEQIKKNTRKYAKRQLTWFKRYDDINWFEYNDYDSALNFIENELTEK